jgi:hypothetical protein
MSTNLKNAYDAATAVTITLASLGSASARESTIVDNTSNLYLDAQLAVSVKVGTVSSDKAVYVYVYGTVDGTLIGDNATGVDAALTMRSPTNLRLLGVINCPTDTTVYTQVFGSVAAAFGGNLPAKWGVVVHNVTGASLSATGSDHAVKYRGIYATGS